ncbi:uncharacterized protein B4U80_07438 [Leptotrombidium deliense]|uniref:Uncharacterized protein n=1 Tax=Leptotrombidium deliense TaxID=299467 RepID=A0A443SVG5_9ACAR|nr:uncharacterized protein B4U80_07438 [Leptotrombidium deliense]
MFLMCDQQNVADLIRELYSLHEQRAYTYHLFDEGHKIYLEASPHYDFVKFRQLVHEVTAEFKRISESVITIEQKMRNECRNTTLADMIYTLQEEEKQKLKLTAKLQLAKQEFIESNENNLKRDEIKATKQQLNNVIENINGVLRDIRYEVDSY